MFRWSAKLFIGSPGSWNDESWSSKKDSGDSWKGGGGSKSSWWEEPKEPAEGGGRIGGMMGFGKPHRGQMSQFEFFELIPLLKLDKQFAVEQFEATVSQSTAPAPSQGRAVSAKERTLEFRGFEGALRFGAFWLRALWFRA